jgi:hypothetical protein
MYRLEMNFSSTAEVVTGVLLFALVFAALVL